MQTIISCHNLVKSYAEGISLSKKKKALRGVSFEVKKGEVLGIIGQNGAGKSTIIKILMGFIKKDSGRIELNGIETLNINSHVNLGYLPENPSLYSHLSIGEHLEFACSLGGYTRAKTKNAIAEILELVDLSANKYTKIKNLSKGMSQRAALANALILEPDLLILDEPMSGLDPIGRQLVIDIVTRSKKKGTTILFCSHILTDVERVCDRLAIIDKGLLKSTIFPSDLAHLVNKNELKNDQTPLENYFIEIVKGI